MKKRAVKSMSLEELSEALRDGMPTQSEMAHASSRNAAKLLRWEHAKRDEIREWKARRRSKGESTDIEEIREA